MTILERAEKQKEFVEKTGVILDTLLDWQLEWVVTHQRPSRKSIEKEWFKFIDLAKQGKEDGIADEILFYKQGRLLMEVFKFFEDVVPEFRMLK